MEKRIYKYTLKVEDKQAINLPVGAQILTVQTQNEETQLYALIDPNETVFIYRYIEIYSTEHNINYEMGTVRRYLATFQNWESLFFHVFERIN